MKKILGTILLLCGMAFGQGVLNGGQVTGGQVGVLSSTLVTIQPNQSLDFGAVQLTVPATQTVTYFNSGTASITINSVSGPVNPVYVSSNTCGILPATLAVGQSCQFSVTFTPVSSGVVTDSITIGDTASGSPRVIFLRGQGTGTLASTASPTSIIFPNTVQSTSSSALDVTYVNTGNQPVSYGGAVLATGTQFSFDDSGCPPLLSVGNSCVVHVTFSPTSAATLTDTLTIHDNASDPTVALRGTGTASGNPQVTLNGSTSPGFATHRYWQFLANSAVLAGSGSGANPPTGNQTSLAELQFLNGVTIYGGVTNVFVDSAPTCGPTHPGSNIVDGNTGTYWVNDWSPTCNAANPTPQPHWANFDLGSSKQVTGLLMLARGDGCDNGWPLATDVKFSDDNITYTLLASTIFDYSAETLGCPGATIPSQRFFQFGNPVSFPSTIVGQSSAQQSPTLVNSGTASLTITSITATGDFTKTGTTCGASLAAGAACTITVKFNPVASGPRFGAITVVDTAPGGTQILSLNGTGVTPVTATSLSLSIPNLSLTAGATEQATATLNLSNGTTLDVTNCALWQSSNLAAGTVSSSGLITAVAAGTVTVTATDSVTTGNCLSSGQTANKIVTVSAQSTTGISNIYFSMGVGTPSTINNYSNQGISVPPGSNVFGGGYNNIGMVRTWDCFESGVLSQSNICRWDKMNAALGTYDFSPFDSSTKAEWLTYAATLGSEIDLIFGNTPSWVGLANTNAGCAYGSSCSAPADVLNTTTACTIKDAGNNTLTIPNLTNGNCAYKQSVYDMLTRKTNNNKFLFCQVGQSATSGCINNVEIVNEWDSCPAQNTGFSGNCTGFVTSQADVQALMVMTYDFYQIKKFVNPAIKVIASGPQGYGTGLPTNIQSEAIKSEVSAWPSVAGRSFASGLGPYVDAFSFHSYTVNPPELVFNQVNNIRNILSAVQCGGAPCSNKPLWQLEFYPSSWESTTSSQLGACNTDEDFIMRFYIEAWAAGVARNSWYQYDHGPITAGGLVGWGSTNHVVSCSKDTNGAVTHAGTAFAQVMNWMVGAVPVGTLNCAISPNQATTGCGHMTDVGGGTPATGVFTLSLTRANAGHASAGWVQAQIAYDTTGNSCYVPPSYAGHYYDSQGNFTAISSCSGNNGQVQIGSRPILLVP